MAAQKGYLMYKGDPELETFYGYFLYDAYRKEDARVFLPSEVENNENNAGILVPIMWEWSQGSRKLTTNTEKQ